MLWKWCLHRRKHSVPFGMWRYILLQMCSRSYLNITRRIHHNRSQLTRGVGSLRPKGTASEERLLVAPLPLIKLCSLWRRSFNRVHGSPLTDVARSLICLKWHSSIFLESVAYEGLQAAVDTGFEAKFQTQAIQFLLWLSGEAQRGWHGSVTCFQWWSHFFT
jgi:hypothetical protein